MDKKKLEQIVDYYSVETSKYEPNKKYSKGGSVVFTIPPFNDVWLSFRELHTNEVMATKTDKNGVIQAWDTYDITRGYPKSLGVERLAEDGRTHLKFSEDEQNIIEQFGKQGKEDTCRHLANIAPLIREKQTEQIMTSTMEKLQRLSEKNCRELIAYVQKRKGIENTRSIRAKLYKANVQRNEQGHLKQQNKEQSRIQPGQCK